MASGAPQNVPRSLDRLRILDSTGLSASLLLFRFCFLGPSVFLVFLVFLVLGLFPLLVS